MIQNCIGALKVDMGKLRQSLSVSYQSLLKIFLKSMIAFGVFLSVPIMDFVVWIWCMQHPVFQED